MKVKIGSARINENGKVTGGKAGDQTGKEVMEQEFYMHSKGWRILRPTAHAKEIAENMKKACANNNIGYSQSGRYGLMRELPEVKGDFSKVKKCCTDCSALVRECVRYAFGKFVPDFNTSSEVFTLTKNGFCKEVKGKLPDDLKPGDILVTKSKGHTAIVVSVIKDKKKKTIDEIVHEVIAGKYGNGKERYEKLKKEGFKPSDVQKLVNEVIANGKEK